MKCEICHKGDATTAYTHIVDDEKKTLLLCADCLPSETKVIPESDVGADFDSAEPSVGTQSSEGQEIPELKKKAKVDFSFAPTTGGVTEKTCSGCGMDYQQFKKVGRLGCSMCYSAFQSDLGPLVKKIHGADQHRGKNWIAVNDGSKSFSEVPLADLRLQLQKAVDKEEFEKAAQIRDLIRLRGENIEGGEGK
mgnify:FL=1